MICFLCCRLKLAVDSLYVRKYFNKDSKQYAMDMMNRLRIEMYKILETVDWMDNQTRWHYKLLLFFLDLQDLHSSCSHYFLKFVYFSYTLLILLFLFRAAALDKAKSMVVHIAYPDELLDNTVMEKYYEKVTSIAFKI